jgi:hypothetical protein
VCRQSGSNAAPIRSEEDTRAIHVLSDWGSDVSFKAGYRAFQIALERERGMNQNRAAFRVLGPGPLPADDILGFADVYLRGMQEVRTLLDQTSRDRSDRG